MDEILSPNIRFQGFYDSWEVKKISDVLTIGSGRDYKHLKKGDIPVYGTGGLMLYVSDFLHDGKSVAIGRKGTIDKPQLLDGKFWTVDTLFYTHNYIDSIPEFIYAVFQRINWNEHNEASGVPSLSKNTINCIKITLPTKVEQTKIAEFLVSVDQKISNIEKKVKLLLKYKADIAKIIFNQQVKFKDTNGHFFPDWQEMSLKKVFQERTDRGGSTDKMLSVTINSGIVPFSSLRRKDNSNVNKMNYKQVHVNDIAYNSMRMWQGASGVSAYNGIVSPAYTVITPNDQNYSRYWSHVFKQKSSINTFQRHSQGLTSDTWNLKFKALSKIKFDVPDLSEQKKIASFLDSIEDRIKVERLMLSNSKRFKSFLLQKMFI
jgi:type I restriction enzyme S subunit